MTETVEIEVWADGYNAQLEGVPLQANPHIFGDQTLRQAWADGWLDADMDDPYGKND